MNKNKVLFLGAVLSLASCKVEKIDPAFLGKIERDKISVTTKIPGTVAALYVNEGDWVKQGDTLGILDIPEVEAKRTQAQGAVKSAEAQYAMTVKGATQAQLSQLQNKVDGLKEQYDFAKKSKDRMSEMLRDSLLAQQKYDEVFAKYMGAKNQYEAAVTELNDAKKGLRIEQQTMALGQEILAQGALSEVGVAANSRYIIAPQDMSIETSNLKVGELALPGYPIFSGYIQNSVFFRFTIAESRIGDLKIGDHVDVGLMYKNGSPIPGKVSAIKALSAYANIATAYPDFEMQQSLFEVRVTPEDKDKVEDLITKGSVSLQFKSK